MQISESKCSLTSQTWSGGVCRVKKESWTRRKPRRRSNSISIGRYGPALIRSRRRNHNPALTGPGEFNQHNWLRAHKVPALILNATTVNTGHTSHFTPTWMGESPWAVHEAADSIPRLEWSTYDTNVGWEIELGRAVAASACVPTVFAPLRLGRHYEQDVEVTLVDDGVHDNQGTVSLLASECNVVLVSDACGQLLLEPVPPPGLTAAIRSAKRSMDTLVERVRLANFFSDLDACCAASCSCT